MRKYFRTSALIIALVASATYASADNFLFGSYGTGDATAAGIFGNSALSFNNTTSLPVVPGFGTITPYSGGAFGGFTTQCGLGGSPCAPTTTTAELMNVTPTWSAALGASQWVSYGQTGPNTPAAGQPGGTYSPGGNYYFTSTFTLTDADPLDDDAGDINVMADDTVIVFLNGIQQNTPTDPGTFPHCSGGMPTCLVSTLVNLDSTDYRTGTNYLTFQLVQGGSVDLGLDFSGVVTPSGRIGTPGVPEPNTLLLLGTGLIGSAGAMFRRLRR